MSEIDEYLKDEYKRSTSFALTPMYKQCLRKLSVKFYGSDANYIATTLRRVIVVEGLSILNGEPIDTKLWTETNMVENTESVLLKVNDKIEELLHFFFQAEDGIRDGHVTGVQTCALPI